MRTILLASCLSTGVATFAGNDHDHEHAPAPVQFVENKGQWHNAVLFRTGVAGATVFLERDGASFVKYADGTDRVVHDLIELTPEQRQAVIIKGHSWRMRFHDANDPIVSGMEKATGYHNYFLGSDAGKWRSRVPLFGEVTYSGIWQGVDAHYYSDGGNLKYDLILAPGADPAVIGLRYEGIDGATIDAQGRYVIKTSVGDVVELAPIAFYADGQKERIQCDYYLDGEILRYKLDRYDDSRKVIIDPTLIASTLSGATGASNYGHCATYDNNGNIFSGARNFGPSYPVTTGAFQQNMGGGGTDISLSKYNPDGSELLWASYLGGSSGENPHSLVANSLGQLCILGSTASSDFPVTTGAFDGSFNGGTNDMTVTVVSEDGTQLIGSSFIGGNGNDAYNIMGGNYGEAYRGEIITNEADDMIIISFTSSADFPVTPSAYQSTLGGGQDAVVLSVNSNVSGLNFATYFGGSADDGGFGIRIVNNEIIFAGHTESSNLSTTAGSLQPSLAGSSDAFVAKLSLIGTELLASTYFGTTELDRCYFIDSDQNGDVWIYGQTEGQINIQPVGTYGMAQGDIYLAKISFDLASAPVTTVLGSTGGWGWSTAPVAFLVDVCNKIYISGYNSASGLPVTSDAFYTDDSFYLAVFDTEMSSLLFGTYYGGSHVDGGTSRFDKAGIVYQGVCSGMGSFPTTPWAHAQTQTIGWDIGVFKIDMEQQGFNIQTDQLQGCAPAEFNFTASGNAQIYYWDPGDGSPQTTGPSLSHIYEDVGTYTITLIGIDTLGCSITDTSYVAITVIDGTPPEASFTVDVITSCEGLGATFTNTSTPASEITWEFGDGWSSNATDPTHSYDSPGQYVVWLTIDDEVCGSSDSAMIVIDIPTPDMEYELQSPLHLCNEGSIELNAGAGHDAYYWSTGAITQTILVNGPGEYIIEVTNGLCSGIDTVMVLAVSEVPKLADVFACPGSDIVLGPPFNVSQITWSNGADSAVTVVDLPGEYTFVAVDEYGCLRFDTIQVQTIDPIELAARVPNVFTPNNDGINDKFQVMALGIDQFRMEVYNRWGQMMYETSNPNMGWNGGVDNSADKVPDGTYFYIITFKDHCTTEPLTTEKGHVTLLR
jgi:gliding motility-associated-like protein